LAIFGLGDDSLGSDPSSAPLIASPTPRTATDERQLRIVTTVIPGPEAAAGAARGTVTLTALRTLTFAAVIASML
jgi:hypothetical protein